MITTTPHNRITTLFQTTSTNVLSVYCTAGFPERDDTMTIVQALQEARVDMVEIGMPFSDPVADGPIIQESSSQALQNGMTLHVLFEQLSDMRSTIHIPVVLMGYINPVIQFGVEQFCAEAARVGVDGVILPDLPMHEYEQHYKAVFERYGLHFITLVTPQTSDERMKYANAVSGGFLYAVSSAGTTGNTLQMDAEREIYFARLAALRKAGTITHPIMIGFGIADKTSFDAACRYANGAIVGSAFIKALASFDRSEQTIAQIVHSVVRLLR
jgi:tryptophan synthase alpha chain